MFRDQCRRCRSRISFRIFDWMAVTFVLEYVYHGQRQTNSLIPSNTMQEYRHPMEDADSWSLRVAGLAEDNDNAEEEQFEPQHAHRYLKHHRHKKDLETLEEEKEEAYLKDMKRKNEKTRAKAAKKHKKLMREMYADPGIHRSTVHGFMIDAGSTGSRMHVYEWEPRVLNSHREVAEAVSGKKLSYPASTSRWTDRLRPGIATFASLPDEELKDAVAEYLSPLLDFARTVLREKEDQFDTFPIFFRATAGMRTLEKQDRQRLLTVIRDLFSNSTFCPFHFEDEYARVLSGEEEAIFGWTGINFVMGNLLKESEGAGTVISPTRTYGALDMGGASTQISFYEPEEDIMSNLFKLQIGQGKHWNLYAHSFLYFGLNEARNRFQAKLLSGSDANDRLVAGVHNPCLPGGATQQTRLNIYIDSDGQETWRVPATQNETASATGGYYQAILHNRKAKGNFEECMVYAKATLHLEQNTWCDFAHKGECSFNGVAMSQLPQQSEQFGEFLAFSNYYHVWNFLGLPERASLEELHNATQHVCSMSEKELIDFNREQGKPADDSEINDICFRSAYAFSILRYGYGFSMDEYITATNVVNGQKVGWALGAMLYEINTFPWEYKSTSSSFQDGLPSETGSGYRNNIHAPHAFTFFWIMLALVGILFSVGTILRLHHRRKSYEVVKGESRPLREQ